ncbi:MAG: 3-dehydroquinate synthase, partial [Pseudomonadota bacterium]|nr:3-dehydroquinate synthase [Pseudomonadota bacterium]
AAPKEMSRDRFLDLMAVDKKVLDGGLRLVLLDGIGRSKVCSDFDPRLLEQTLEPRLSLTGS